MRDSILFKTEEEAEKVLEAMKAIFYLYGYVTVSDLKDLVGFTTTYHDSKRGWKSLEEIKINNEVEPVSMTFPEPHNIL